MKIIFGKGTKKYIEEKNIKALTVDMGLTGCCGVHGIVDPEVKIGVPDVGTYNLYKEDGLDIYVNKTLRFKDNTMTFVFNNFLFTKKLAVDGYDYD